MAYYVIGFLGSFPRSYRSPLLRSVLQGISGGGGGYRGTVNHNPNTLYSVLLTTTPTAGASESDCREAINPG